MPAPGGYGLRALVPVYDEPWSTRLMRRMVRAVPGCNEQMSPVRYRITGTATLVTGEQPVAAGDQRINLSTSSLSRRATVRAPSLGSGRLVDIGQNRGR
jgi:hypothetical protein